jgi:hypothetical protein
VIKEEEEEENTSSFSFDAAGDWGVEEEAHKTARVTVILTTNLDPSIFIVFCAPYDH